MDDLLREFLTETGETLDVVDVELVRFEQEPNNREILGNVFRLVHTIKGTCGFLKLPRLETLTHAAETLLGNFRDGQEVTGEAVSLVLASIDRVKMLLDALEHNGAEPEGDDRDLISQLQRMAGVDPEAERPVRPRQISLKEIERTLREPGNGERGAGERGGVDAGSAAPQGRVSEVATAAAVAAREQPDSRVASHSIRVDVATLEHLMTMVSELVLTRNQLIDLVRRHEDSEFKAPLQRLSNVTAELQDGVLKTRMQPIGTAWQKLPRIVRDLSTELGKPIELEMYGADTELDRQVLELIKDPLTHMVRNSADHGLEAPAERIAAGKHERGIIRLSACHQGGHIVIEITDDGRGLDTARIRAKAVALGLASESAVERMSDAQAQAFIFAPGFSTMDTVTSVSGRGVGMDVVRTNVDQIGGMIDVKSVPGRGTTFTIKIPLTLAIVSALIVEAGGDRFAIPQLAVLELVRARNGKEHRIERIKDAALLRLRSKLLPLIELKSLLAIASPTDRTIDDGFVVVMQVGNQTFGMVVDRVFHTEEIVVKPMSSKLRHIAMFSGTTILGDGSVILIVDPSGVAQGIGDLDLSHRAAPDEAAQNDAATESLLVFRAGSPNPMAVPISLVTRLEEVDAATIEMTSSGPLVQYRGHLMPLVPVNGNVRVRQSGTQPLLVFSDDRRTMGLLVDEIVDIVEDRLEIEVTGSEPGLVGSAVIKGQATEIIDVAHFLPLAFDDWRGWGGRDAVRAPRNLLLVDDTPFFRNMLAPVLKAAGYVVTGAASARDALALVEAGGRFDVVVTDIEMPDMDGLALAAALRGNPRTAAVPIIGLSSLVSDETAERGKQVGLRGYVAKFDRPGLIAALQTHVAGSPEARAA